MSYVFQLQGWIYTIITSFVVRMPSCYALFFSCYIKYPAPFCSIAVCMYQYYCLDMVNFKRCKKRKQEEKDEDLKYAVGL